MDKLDLILQKLDKQGERLDRVDAKLEEQGEQLRKQGEQLKKQGERLDGLEAGQKELYQLTSAIRYRQELADAKLDALSTDVNKLYGKLASGREETRLSLKANNRHVRAIEHDLDVTMERVDILEKSGA